MHSFFAKITYRLTFGPVSLQQFLRAIWNTVSQAIVLILPPIKLNSQLSLCAFFFLTDIGNLKHLYKDFLIFYGQRRQGGILLTEVLIEEMEIYFKKLSIICKPVI